MKKRITSVLMALALCLTLLPTAALAVDGDGMNHASHPKAMELKMNDDGTLMKDGKDWTPADGSDNLTLKAGSYYLSTGLTLTNYSILISGNVTLCLNGNDIVCDGKTKDGHVISVGAYGTTAHLTLTDCQTTAGTINGGGKASTVVNLYGGCEMDMYGGTITGGGVGVYVDNRCTFKMSGGAITGNKGRGVNMVAGTFEMSGGAITGNRNGGVYVSKSVDAYPCTFNVSGKAEVTGNEKNNVYLREGQTIHVTGAFTGTIGVTAQTPSAGTSIVTVSDANYIKGTFTSDNGAYGISKDSSGNITLKEHNWNYTKSDTEANTITAKCADCGADGGSVTLTAPAAGTLTYDGTAKRAKLVPHDWLGTDVDNIKITYRYNRNNVITDYNGDPTDANEYEASIKLGEATASVEYTIEKAALTADKFNFSAQNLTYTGETKGLSNAFRLKNSLTGLGEITLYYYLENGGSDEVIPCNAGTYTVRISVTEGANFQDASNLTSGDWKFTIQKATPTIKVTDQQITKDGVAVDISKWASFNNTDSDADLAYALVGAPTGIKLDGTKLTAVNNESTASTFKIKVSAVATANFNPPEEATFTVTVEDKAPVQLDGVTQSSMTYGDGELPAPVYTAPTGTTAVTITYTGINDTKYATTEEKPTQAGDYRVTVKCTTPTDVYIGTAEFTIAPKSIEDMTVTLDNTTLVYDGTEQSVNVQAVGNLTADDYTVTNGNAGKNAGNYTVTVTGKGNYGGTVSKEWKIIPAVLTISRVTVPDKAYDGTADATGTDVTFTELKNNENFTAEDYAVTAQFNNASVEQNKSVTGTVKLKENSKTKNYVLKDGTFTASGNITKADAPTSTEQQTVTVTNNRAHTYEFDLAALLPKLESPKEYGEVTYGAPTVNLSSGYYTGGAQVEDGKLILPIQAVETKETGSIGSVEVKVSTTNYHDFTLTINVEATNKTVPTGTPTLSKTTLAWGEQLNTITLSGAMKDGDTEVKGTFVWTSPETTPDSMSDFEAEWKFTPTETAVYAETSGMVTIKVIKATPTGAPKYTAITTGGKTLKDASLTAGTIQPEGTIQWELDETTVVTANTAYKWVFTPKDQEHYKELTGFITPYSVSSNTGGSSSGGSSSGGSSSGGSSSSDRDSYDSNPIIKTETKNNPDGSTTKTETRRDGSVTQTTTGKDGGVSKTETKPDGSSVTENKAADGSTGTVKTDKNGQTEAKTALSNKAIEDAKKNGEAVKAPVEVKASRNSSTAPTVKVELPKGAGETKVEIPVSNVKPGTVAVLVHPDGTEEILKNSIPTEDGIQLTVNGNATVKIVDNSKDFVDTRNHWAEDAIDFVSARGLVNGVSDTIYAPNASATRAQLWTILARQNDADLSGGANWYERAQLWSKDKGISDGTEPNAAINRAQMVTMLWRTMGQPTATDKVSFADVPADSYYAQAVAWAVESGITAGVGGGRFDPSATCTRAQIAVFLYRYMK